MEFEKKPYQHHLDSVFSRKISGGKRRNYFIDVKKTKTDDLYLVLSEHGNKAEGIIEKHRIFLYKEDLNRFLNAVTEAADKIKEMMPDYDFDQFDGRFDTISTDFKPKSGEEDVVW
jgi:hypothetical protein